MFCAFILWDKINLPHFHGIVYKITGGTTKIGGNIMKISDNIVKIGGNIMKIGDNIMKIGGNIMKISDNIIIMNCKRLMTKKISRQYLGQK